MFILLSNLLGLVPGLLAPTSVATVPLGVALLCFLYYHYYGFRENGLGYFKQFVGPIWWISWMMLPIELISHFARILSLTVRLYANMFAGEMVTLVFFSLVPVRHPARVYELAPEGGSDPGLHFHAADHDLRFPGSGARPLEF